MQVRQRGMSHGFLHIRSQSIWGPHGTGKNETKRLQPSFEIDNAIGTHLANDICLL